jgi:hypothetical protein
MSQTRWRRSTGRDRLTGGYAFKWQSSVTTSRWNTRIMSIRIAAHRTLPTDQGRVVHACWSPCMGRCRRRWSHGFIAPSPCIRALCAPHWNSFLPSSPEALRTHRRERPLLARKGN